MGVTVTTDVFQAPEEALEQPREPSRALPHPWPFPYSIESPGRLVRNRFWPPDEEDSR